MVEKRHPQLSVRRQSELLEVNRNNLAPAPKKGWSPKPEHRELLELAPVIHAKDPTMGARQMGRVLRRNGFEATRWVAGKVMEFLGLKAIYRRPRTTLASKGDPRYPYLLRGREITAPDEVWAVDITYIPWRRGHVYLFAVLDWHTRAVLSWRVSTTMDVNFCLEALCEAVGVAGQAPEILNTDQGSQFTGVEWLSAVESLSTRVSMDGRGRWVDNVLVERLWRSVKHEWVLLHEYNTVPELEGLLEEWVTRYNEWRPHTANGGETPWQAYRGKGPELEIELLGGRGARPDSGRPTASLRRGGRAAA